MKNTISEIAEAIINSENAAKLNQKDIEHKKYQEIITHLENEFRIGFSDQLDLLKKENITWSADLQDKRYKHLGAYILFQLNGQKLRMDFNNRCSYRYEFVSHEAARRGRYGTMVYGDWGKDKFILFIYHNLFKKANPSVKKRCLTKNDISSAQRILSTIRQETMPVEGHADSGAIEDCFNELSEILELMVNKIDVDFLQEI